MNPPRSLNRLLLTATALLSLVGAGAVLTGNAVASAEPVAIAAQTHAVSPRAHRARRAARAHNACRAAARNATAHTVRRPARRRITRVSPLKGKRAGHVHAACTAPASEHATQVNLAESHTARDRSTGAAGRNRHSTTARAGKRRHAAPTPTSPSPSSSTSGPTIASVLATPCQNTELAPEPGNLAEIDAATLCLVNQERARNGEQPLQVNAQLQQAAQSHSEEMITDDYFAHVSPSGLTPVERIEQTGYIPSSQDGYTLGENIAWGTLQLSTPAAIVAAWIASPEHLANILYAPYRDTAVAAIASAPASLAEGQPGAVYSQEFGVIVS